MITKSIKELSAGDVLIKRDTEESCILKSIVSADNEKLDEFHFEGFVINRRVLSRFFSVKDNNFLVKNT